MLFSFTLNASFADKCKEKGGIHVAHHALWNAEACVCFDFLKIFPRFDPDKERCQNLQIINDLAVQEANVIGPEIIPQIPVVAPIEFELPAVLNLIETAKSIIDTDPKWDRLKTTKMDGQYNFLDEQQRSKYVYDFENGKLLKQDMPIDFSDSIDGKLDCIYVISIEKRLYMSCGNRQVGRHHNHFLAGEDVLGGGHLEISANDSKISSVNPNSGHYKPGLKHFLSTIFFFFKKDVLKKETELHYDHGDSTKYLHWNDLKRLLGNDYSNRALSLTQENDSRPTERKICHEPGDSVLFDRWGQGYFFDKNREKHELMGYAWRCNPDESAKIVYVDQIIGGCSFSFDDGECECVMRGSRLNCGNSFRGRF